MTISSEFAEFDAWNYRPTAGYAGGNDLVGYKVAATDGDIGKVDRATYEVDGASLVVDTGPWIFGKKVLLPAGLVERVDPAEEKVYVDRTKDQIKDAPEYDPDPEESTGTPTWGDDDYRSRLGGYYDETYRTGGGAL
ncbi:PRC-barrel domain-containing protein [Tenggerimyces flavus]|uniref:PRC-barrel domain-containing protein n=1 Tax=Tenggerimyces flavus TaxID=1708749 RepID=A0ABV7YNY3_9ACTN|nr:PRC-barrel domain-containing protein [Tenggerimyces flavus]MBM7786503.1 hypothetical protein [Tenggerimyces flavus]